MSGLIYVSNITEEDFAYTILEGCRAAGTFGCTGNTSKDYDVHPAIMVLKREEGHRVNIFKPQSQAVLLDLIKQSEKEKAIAVGIDIDGAGSVNFALAGKPVFRKTIDELKEFRRSTRLPFIIKGIMSAGNALAAVEAGADGGVRTGFNAVIMLVLGADFVLAGRLLAREAVSNGIEGVKRILESIRTDIKIAMIMTSCNTLKNIDENVLVREN